MALASGSGMENAIALPRTPRPAALFRQPRSTGLSAWVEVVSASMEGSVSPVPRGFPLVGHAFRRGQRGHPIPFVSLPVQPVSTGFPRWRLAGTAVERLEQATAEEGAPAPEGGIAEEAR